MSEIKVVRSRFEYWNDGPYAFRWHKEGDTHYLHREDGPAYVFMDARGIVLCEKYYYNGELHRTDGPAFRKFDLQGNLLEEQYIINELFHREDGPALTYYNFDGTIDKEFYYLHGEFIDEEDWILRTDPLYKELI